MQISITKHLISPRPFISLIAKPFTSPVIKSPLLIAPVALIAIVCLNSNEPVRAKQECNNKWDNVISEKKAIMDLYDKRINEARKAWYEALSGSLYPLGIYPKMEATHDEYNVLRYHIKIFYKAQNLQQAYKTYITYATNKHFEHKWPPYLPTKNKTIKWQHIEKENMAESKTNNNDNTLAKLDIILMYRYINNNKIYLSYEALNANPNIENVYANNTSRFILEFEEKKEGTYLTLTSKARDISFNCNIATSITQKTICKANLKDDIAMHYLLAMLSDEINNNDTLDDKGAVLENLESLQKQWLHKRDKCFDNMSCIKRAYKMRNTELKLQLQELLDKRMLDTSCKKILYTNLSGKEEISGLSYYYICEYRNATISDIYKQYLHKYGHNMWFNIDTLSFETLTQRFNPNTQEMPDMPENLESNILLPRSITYKWLNDSYLKVEVQYEDWWRYYSFIAIAKDVQESKDERKDEQYVVVEIDEGYVP